MNDKVHHTRGIVLRAVKYGETSLIVTMLTELFGLQSYLVNGVRVSTRKGAGRANLFQPAAILDMIVYHNELKQLQRIKEFRWGVLYQHVLSDIRKNAVALFLVEPLGKCLKQPESNADLYHFAEDALLHLDNGSDAVTANFPLFFALHLPVFFGLRIQDNYSAQRSFLDLQEGLFVTELPFHTYLLDDKYAFLTSQLLKVQHPAELAELRLNQEFRRALLQAYEQYYALHVQDFGSLRTLPVLKDILD